MDHEAPLLLQAIITRGIGGLTRWPVIIRRPAAPPDGAALTERGLHCLDAVACIGNLGRFFFAYRTARTFTLIR